MAWLNPITEFEEIYTAKFEEIRRKLQVVVKSREVSEDLAQDAFVKAYRLRHTWKPISSPESWIYKIGYNLALDHLRYSNRRLKILIKYNYLSEASVYDIFKIEDRLVVEEFLKVLNSRQIVVIELYYFYGLTDPDIAVKLGRSKNTIVHIRHDALVKMRHQYKKLSDGY